MFISAECKSLNQIPLQSVSSKVMFWCEGIWLFDISQTLSYWNTLAKLKRTQLIPLLHEVLQLSLLSELKAQNADNSEQDFRAALAPTPWSAALLLNHMRKRNLSGLLSTQSPFGERALLQLDWETWFQTAEQCSKHFVPAGFKKKTVQQYRDGQNKLKKSVHRLAIDFPAQTEGWSYPSVERRFGSVVATLWAWTHAKNNPFKIEKYYFPWRTFEFKEPKKVFRFLENSSVHWDNISQYIVDDLDVLCRRMSNPKLDRVVKITWKITFDDLSQHDLFISFRNPHDLNSEKGMHKTTLLQSNYVFTNYMRTFQKQLLNTDFLVRIQSWTLILSEIISLPETEYDLFGLKNSVTDKNLEILKLENELPVPLLKYTYNNHWLHTDAYIAVQCSSLIKFKDDFSLSLDALSKNRPLFVLKKPKAILSNERPLSALFLESVLSKWWNASESPSEKIYFRWLDSKGNLLWVCKNHKNKLEIHGFFG